MIKPKENGRILTLPPGRSADFPVRSNVERQEGFRRLLEPWEGRGLLRTGKSALRWRCQGAPRKKSEIRMTKSEPGAGPGWTCCCKVRASDFGMRISDFGFPILSAVRAESRRNVARSERKYRQC